MTFFLLLVTFLSLIIWLYLILARGQFWLSNQKINPVTSPLKNYPKVSAIIPARNEADVLPISLTSLFNQDYQGEFSIILIDDKSSDDTGTVAQEIADQSHKSDQITIISGQALEIGWTGKLWAMKQGITEATEKFAPDYFLFTDADIAHAPDNLTQLVTKAVQEKQALVSLMVLLRCDSFWEKFLIPAFVFFFEKLYPFPLVNNPNSPIAAAAGGCILIRRDILEKIGGIEILKQALIDDCSLAIAVKKYLQNHPENTENSIWLGLTESTYSLRPYPDLASIWNMVARTAFTQLNYSTLWLIGTIFGMFLTYLAAPLGLIWGLVLKETSIIIISTVTLLLIALSYSPTLRLYKLSPLRALTLPLIALFYSLMTVDSALRYWRGQGGGWKGRVYPN
ncbi:glycosyltransferase [Microcystis sp. M061S2]|uniref:glycosyltransferase n=1 Tax=Microcystis sp. M061S2 TaxID=2771171 RepID=UPI002582E0BC|nr:glycosyltransferase [Microcystis sp. M061S2]MCA2653323.1 glycosyltransferase [Microcystis sp. M061S2]